MAGQKDKLTVFQRLNRMFTNDVPNIEYNTKVSNQVYNSGDEVLLRTTNRAEYDKALLQGRQENLLARQWRKAENNIQTKSLANLSAIKLMYRDADLMDDFPEIGAAIDIVMEESCSINDSGFMLNITSRSERVKNILQDLFYNRLQVNVNLPMIIRATVKYGNNFMLLNLSGEDGITGWKQLPVYEVERFESSSNNPYISAYTPLNTTDPNKALETQFVWVGESEFIPYKHWQIAHFRLLYDSKFLPYGISFLNKARRHFRMLSMMEDFMLIYRMERSWERRVYKVNVGGIDPKDVPALVNEVANEFKRTPVYDPLTGQIDLRKNIADVTADYFIPVRDPGDPSPIETLQGAQNLTAMDDIKFIQNKVMTALRVPASFIGYEEGTGEGKNLSLLDIRFTKTINRIQQYVLMELNKIAIIHLKLLGFDEDLTNFSLSMNNPSSQAQMLEIENLGKKITVAKDAITDAGNGISLFSVTRALKTILGWSDKEIKDNLEELRLERGLAAELEKTSEIIKRTHLFDPVDNIYGEPGAEYTEGKGGEGGMGDDMGSGFGGGGGFGGDFGGDLDFGGDDMGGAEGEMDFDEAGADMGMDMGGDNSGGDVGEPENLAESIMDSISRKNNIKKRQLLESRRNKYIDLLNEHIDKISTEEKESEDIEEIPLMSNNLFINEEMTNLCEQLENKAYEIKDINKPHKLLND